MHSVIAYPGTEGSFSCAAAREAFPGEDCVGFETFEAAANAVVEGHAAYALLPVENSFAGAVQLTYTLMEKLPLHIVGETAKQIRQQLLGLPGAEISHLREITSHPQAIAQCSEFLSRLPHVRIVPSVNTAFSAREVAAGGDPTCAAIASEEAAQAFGLVILCRDIQTSITNTTRFVIVSSSATPLGAPSKATVAFTVNNQVGALVRVLQSFAESGLNMTRIESRPLPDTPFYYFFTADFEGNMDFHQLNHAMEAARSFTSELRLLGAYPKADLSKAFAAK